MSESRDKWNRIYSIRPRETKIAAVLTRHSGLIRSGGVALDIACGQGANSEFLADMGLRVDGWDISPVAIAQLMESASKQQLDIKERMVVCLLRFVVVVEPCFTKVER